VLEGNESYGSVGGNQENGDEMFGEDQAVALNRWSGNISKEVRFKHKLERDK
jgi:hypothetical protein